MYDCRIYWADIKKAHVWTLVHICGMLSVTDIPLMSSWYKYAFLPIPVCKDFLVATLAIGLEVGGGVVGGSCRDWKEKIPLKTWPEEKEWGCMLSGKHSHSFPCSNNLQDRAIRFELQYEVQMKIGHMKKCEKENFSQCSYARGVWRNHHFFKLMTMQSIQAQNLTQGPWPWFSSSEHSHHVL